MESLHQGFREGTKSRGEKVEDYKRVSDPFKENRLEV